ncbi:hypothetical protein C9374_004835 [Naegleria lovaniensis]|uniref:Uncharacterized protein n=1 Tax=Naegleria lovaniensis TaxID=51637 RepID=A0AA88GQW1_NAELO|nr:uncharacterized protein C9374_004835 [Naegleria lovaniensis]KAG2382868.1 hypothetical protein C9374_004835 [Naegleria lovaniensis]
MPIQNTLHHGVVAHSSSNMYNNNMSNSINTKQKKPLGMRSCHTSRSISKEDLLQHLCRTNPTETHNGTFIKMHHCGSWEEWLNEHVQQVAVLNLTQKDNNKNYKNSSQQPCLPNCIQLQMNKFHHFVNTNFPILEKQNSSPATIILEHVKTVGVIHHFKTRDQSTTTYTPPDLTKKEKLLKFVASEEFGVASMICPPLLLAHWYGVYRQESLLLNCAQYVASGWRLDLESKLLHTIATLYKYPKSVKTRVDNNQDLEQFYPRTMILKSVSLEEIMKDGFTIRNVHVKSNSRNLQERNSKTNIVYHLCCGASSDKESETTVLCSFVHEEYALSMCQLLVSLLTLAFPCCEIPRTTFKSHHETNANSSLPQTCCEESNHDQESAIHYHSFHFQHLNDSSFNTTPPHTR